MPTRPLLALTVALMFALATPASASADCRPAPPIDQALRLWDGVTAAATVDGFWEMKRTRTEPPDFTPAAG